MTPNSSIEGMSNIRLRQMSATLQFKRSAKQRHASPIA